MKCPKCKITMGTTVKRASFLNKYIPINFPEKYPAEKAIDILIATNYFCRFCNYKTPIMPNHPTLLNDGKW